MMTSIKPIIKWVGGKTQSMKILYEYIYLEKNDTLYVEPFIGGGSVFLTLQPTRFIISDVNPNLMCMYKTVKEKCDDLCAYLTEFTTRYNSTAEDKLDLYLDLRKKFNQMKYNTSRDCAVHVEISGAFILLNKLCFNGLYRENSQGEFNVPFGKKASVVVDIDNIKCLSDYLNKNSEHGKIECKSYEKVVDGIKSHEGSVMLYMDPPYHVCEQSKFVQYISSETNIFTDKDAHTQLYKMMGNMGKNKNWHIVCSNSFNAFTHAESLKHKLGTRCITVNKNINRSTADELVSFTKDSHVWKSINTYFNGKAKFKTADEEKQFIDIFKHIEMYNNPTKKVGNMGQIGELAVKRVFSEHGIDFLKCPFKESVRPDGYIEMGSDKYIVEVKSRTYTGSGTASEKIDCIARKLHVFYKKYGCKSIVIFTAGQIYEKSGDAFLNNDNEYVEKFKAFAKNTSGVEYWLSFNELEHWIKSKQVVSSSAC